MADTPLEKAILGAAKCVICGAGYGKCDCWAKCETCGRSYRKGETCQHGEGSDTPEVVAMGTLKL
jgi:hypothetical protein